MRIAYLGPPQTNTHVAAKKAFGPCATYVHAPTVEDVFRLVERQAAERGVVPVENSLEGAVTHTLDRFIDFKQSPAQIHGEIEARIQHSLLLHAGVKLQDIGMVFSHPQALAQCRRWLDVHLPEAGRWETSSTAEAVEYLFRKEGLEREVAGRKEWMVDDVKFRAAIARRELARGRQLRALPIPEQQENKTRFLILRLGAARRGAHNKTSILFALKDRSGALYDALAPFKRCRINLTKIESRPAKLKAWEYYFFIDVSGHVKERRVAQALSDLKRYCTEFRVLGSYPVASTAQRRRP